MTTSSLAKYCFLVAAAMLPAVGASGAVYYVDQSHPRAADANAGTEALPFKTIAAAVAKVKPGDTVLVKSGTYRETVIYRYPKWETDTTDRMTLAAFPGAKVVVKGSEVVKGRFEPVRVALRPPAKAAAKAEYDPNAWRKEIGIDGARQAEAAPVVTPPGEREARDAKFAGIYGCTWETYTSLVFTDEAPLKQVGLKSSPQRNEKGGMYKLCTPYNGRDISDMKPGTFFYDAPARKLYVWLPDSGDPNHRVIEAGVRGYGIVLEGTWTVSGLTCTHYQDNFAQGQDTAFAISGRRPIMENCRVVNNGWIAVIVHGFDGVLRGNEIGNNGLTGLCPGVGWRFLIENNEFYNNDMLGGVVACHSGDKICQLKDTRILRNRFRDGSGLWFDINVNNTLVAENLFENCLIGLYVEISRWVVVSNNVFRNCGRGVMVYSSDVLVANNVFDGCGEGVLIMGYPRGCSYKQSYYDPVPASVLDALLAVRNNLVVNNIIINSPGCYIACTRDDAYNFGNFSDHNVFVWTYAQSHHYGNHIKFMAEWDSYYGRMQFWRMERHFDEHSVVSDENMYRRVLAGANWLSADDYIGDAHFVDRANGDYHLRPDSPLKGRGVTIPMVLNSTYIPAKDCEVNSRAWAMTGVESPAGKGRAVMGEAWTQKFYRIQPLPRLHRLVDLDEQRPADPGINYTWRDTGKYPEFRHDGPAETVPDDAWVVNPANRLKNPSFAESLYGQMHSVDSSQKALSQGWQCMAGKIITFDATALAQLTPQTAGSPATGAQKFGPIRPNTEYLMWADMKVDGLKDGYATTGRIYLAAGKDLTPIKSAEVKSAGDRRRHWNTYLVDYKSGADAKADPFVGKDLYVVFSAVTEGAKNDKSDEVVGVASWDNFQLLTGEPLPAT